MRTFIYIFVVLLLAILLIVSYNYLKDPDRFPVRVVKVEGQLTHLSRSQIQSIIEPFVSHSFVTVKINALRQALQADPWVYQAQVSRHWPDAVTVTVVEQVPVAYWNDDALVNEHAEAFTPSSLPTLNLPHWRGPLDQLPRVAKMYDELNQLVAPKGVRIASLTLSARWSWDAVLNNGLKIALGSQDVPARVARWVATSPIDLQTPTGVQYVDLRYTNGFVVNHAGR